MRNETQRGQRNLWTLWYMILGFLAVASVAVAVWAILEVLHESNPVSH